MIQLETALAAADGARTATTRRRLAPRPPPRSIMPDQLASPSIPLLPACLLLAGLALPAHAAAEERPGSPPLTFAVIGDVPYFAWEEMRLEQLVAQLGREPLAFVLHIGDIKSGRDRCDDRMYADRLRLFQHSPHPFILIAGDNDWTDCHRASNGGYDPLERLARWRAVFHAGQYSLGQGPMRLERQSDDPAFTAYRENMRWRMQGVLFASVHVVGSNNNAAMREEFEARSSANLAWLDTAFGLAAQHDVEAVAIAIHGDPLFELGPGARRRSGFEAFLQRLRAHCEALGKPVLLIHGDSHQYRWDRPWPCLRRLESFGSPSVGWVRVTARANGGEYFAAEPNPSLPLVEH
jgi:hypothetical protein